MATTPKRRVRKPGSKVAPASGRSTKKQNGFDANDDDIREMLPRGLGRAFVESKLHEKRIREAGLTPPGDFSGDMPELPDDIAATDHTELSNLMLAFQNALSTCRWQQAMAYIESDIMEEIRDYLNNKALIDSTQSNDAKRRADAETNEQVIFFTAKYKTAYHDYVRYRDLAGTIEGKIKVLSRVGGFKDDEDEASDRTIKPKIGRVRSRRSRD